MFFEQTKITGMGSGKILCLKQKKGVGKRVKQTLREAGFSK